MCCLLEVDELNQAFTALENKVNAKDEGGNDYMIPVFTIIVVMIAIAAKKRRDG